jgi:predicted nucleotidyltransferase
MEKKQDLLDDLPGNVRMNLTLFVDSAKDACGPNLLSAVLFGSAAEGRLRPSSDVNLILVFKEFDTAQIDRLRENLRLAHAAIRLGVMFILAEEIPAATEAFAVKFMDILHRHRVLYGADPFAGLEIPREAALQRLQQMVVNLTLRLRERYALVSLREEHLTSVIAEVAGPLRAGAATLLRLEGGNETHPKEALQALTRKLAGRDWSVVLENISTAREEQELKPGEASATVLGLLELLKAMRTYVRGMK